MISFLDLISSLNRYVGDSLDTSPHLSEAELNTNRFNPDAKAGQDGDPVFMKPGDEHLSKRLWHANKFNIVASDRIPLNRTLKDVRKPVCKKKFDHLDIQDLPSASVVIVFHNEAWSTLMRTIWSVIDRSPSNLLEEIILVDDSSNRTFLAKDLDRAVQVLPVTTRIIRMQERVGLIKARLAGAVKAKGQVLVFLDAHCETTQGWLEPLLLRVSESRSTVICPVIDIINDDTFAYTRSFSLHWGAFNWELHFR